MHQPAWPDQAGLSALSTGRMITFFSAKGGNGTSTLCVNLANMLAQQIASKTMLVVDMALPMGSLSLITGVHRDSSIVKLMAEAQSFDPVSLAPYCAFLEPWTCPFYQVHVIQGSAGT